MRAVLTEYFSILIESSIPRRLTNAAIFSLEKMILHADAISGSVLPVGAPAYMLSPHKKTFTAR